MPVTAELHLRVLQAPHRYRVLLRKYLLKYSHEIRTLLLLSESALCSTDQYQIADFSIKALDPFMEIGLFIISTTDQDRRRFIAWIPLIAASGFVPLESL